MYQCRPTTDLGDAFPIINEKCLPITYDPGLASSYGLKSYLEADN